MDWNDNPRIDIEKRIKQLEFRIGYLLRYAKISIDYDEGVAVRLYPSLIPRSKVDKARKLMKACRMELNLKWRQLKSF